jgi:TolA-binding protein
MFRTSRRAINARTFFVLLLIGLPIGLPASAAPAQDGGDELRDYLSANGLLNRGLYELATAEYRKFLGAHADHEKAPVARYGLGVCLFRTEKYDEAIKELRPLADNAGFAFAAEIGTILGQSYLAKKEYVQAAEAFERVAERFADHDLGDDAAAGLAEALYLAGEHEKAAERCRAFCARWSDSPLRERVRFFWGLAEMARGDHAKAGVQFQQLLADHRDGPFADQATLLLAQCQHRAGNLDQALRAYRDVLSRKESRFVAEALLGLGTLLHQQGKPKEAGELLDQLLENFADSPQAPAARLARGRAWFDQGEYDRAFGLFEQVAKAGGEASGDADYWSGKCRLRQDRFDEAAARLTRAIEAHADSELMPEMCYDRAVALVRAGKDADAAVKALTEFRARFGEHAMAADALHLLALTEHQQKRYEQSRAQCEAFLKTYPKHELAARVRFLLGENDFLAGKYEAAIPAYEAFLSAPGNGPMAAGARFRLGMAYFRTGKLDQAEPILAEAARSAGDEPMFRPALLALGDIYFERGDWPQAERRLNDYLVADEKAPSADAALLKLGLARQRQHNHDGAIQAYDKLLSDHPDGEPALQARFERGQALVALGRAPDAAPEFERVLETGGADSRFAPFALNHLGAIALQRKEYAKAAEYFDRVLAADPPEQIAADATFGRGQAHIAAKRFDKAEADFRAVLEQHPGHASATQARAQLAIALARQDRYADAVGQIEQVEGDGWNGIDAGLRSALQYEKAWCLRRLDKSQDAASVYRTLLNDQGAGELGIHAMLELAEIEAGQKRYKEAAELLRRLRTDLNGRDSPPADVRSQGLYRLAVCEYELGNLPEAAKLFGEFLDQSPDSELAASAGFFCGEALFKTNQHDKAAERLERVVQKFPKDPAFGPALLRLGEALAALQKWAKSEKAFTDYLERFGDSEHWFQAQFGVGWARENQGRFDEAKKAYGQVIEKHKGPTAARAQFQIGECLFAQEQYERAAAELLKVDILYAYPEWSAAALFEAGRCFEKLNRPGEAREQFKRLAEVYRETRWANLANQRLAAMAADAPPGRATP